MLTASEWHDYAFSEGFSDYNSPHAKDKAAELSGEHEAHHCPLCDFHISNTLLPGFNCIHAKQIVLAGVTFPVLTLPLPSLSFCLPESRGPPFCS
jgi:hypothetical protein